MQLRPFRSTGLLVFCVCALGVGLTYAINSLMGSASFAEDAIQFVDDGFQEFAQGSFDDGGHNFYAAHDGTLRNINRFDLNEDGHLDVIFNCTHNTYQMLPATCGTIHPDRRAAKSTDIAVEGSQQVACGDLNRDGFTDLVFCPNPIGVHHDRRFVSIAWGGPGGWVPQRINSPLPMNGAASVAIVELNGDEWPDIAVLERHGGCLLNPRGGSYACIWEAPQVTRSSKSTTWVSRPLIRLLRLTSTATVVATLPCWARTVVSH